MINGRALATNHIAGGFCSLPGLCFAKSTGHERAGSYFTGKQNQSWAGSQGRHSSDAWRRGGESGKQFPGHHGPGYPPACPGKQDCRPEAESSWRNNPGIYSAKGRKRKAAPGDPDAAFSAA